MAEQFKQATLKHEEILLHLKEGLEGDAKSTIERLLTYSIKAQERLEKLLAE